MTDIPELDTWTEAKKTLSYLKGDLSVTIFKLALHHESNLPKNWCSGIENHVQ